MELQYVKNKSDNAADIFLYAPIGGGGVNAQNFVAELQFLDSLGLDEINVRINSSGGSVIEGFGIFSAIRNAKTTVNTHIDGIAASIAGIIAMAGKNRTIVDFGRLMIHDPSFGGGKLSAKDKEVLDTIKSSLITILTNNSALDEGEIFDLMTEETWFNAEDAWAFGFVDSVVATKRDKEAVRNLSLEEIINLATDEAANIDINTNQNNNKMLNLVNHLGLAEDAQENDILDAVKVLENKVTETEAALNTANDDNNEKIEGLNNTVSEKDATITALVNEVATMVVDNAIAEGKFKAENKTSLVEKAVADLDGFKAIVNAVTLAPVSINAMIETPTEEPTTKTFNDWSKEDPKGLLNMLKTDPTAYAELYKAQFGVEPKI